MAYGKPAKKHAFDVALIFVLAAVIVPILLICALLIIVSDGKPVLYRSKRRVYRHESMMIAKFRTMRRDAERIANRDTVAIQTTRFLNIDIDSPLYTPVGRWIERLMLTELPQLYYVLQGRMCLVGNRPLPENVIAALKVENDDVEARFLIPAGITGPVQLVGRDFISDADRLSLEGYYCSLVNESYSILLDVKVLFYTVLVGLRIRDRFTVAEVLDLLAREAGRQGAIRAARGPLSRLVIALSTAFGWSSAQSRLLAGEFVRIGLERNRASLADGE